MALYYNNNNVSPSNNVYFNNQASKQVFHNGTLVWKKQKVLWQNGDQSANSGGWSRRTMQYAPGAWNFGTTIYAENMRPTSHFGILAYTNNKFSIPAGSQFSFYLSGAGNNTPSDTNVALWYSEFYVVFFTSPPPEPMQFAHPTDWIKNSPKHAIWESPGQHADWTYWWPKNNTTITLTPVLNDPVHIGFYYSGYDAAVSSLHINNVTLIN